MKSHHTISFFSLKSHFSKIKFLSLSSFFSLESKTHLFQFSIQTSTMLSHTFLFTPNLHQLTTLSHCLSFLSFFHPPLHCTTAIPKYPWSATIKSYPHLIFHTNIFFFFRLQLRELRKSISKCSVGEFLSIFFFNF